MSTDNPKFSSVGQYISSFPSEVQAILERIRIIIKKAAPQSDEHISYGIPFYEYGGKGYSGRLIYFAAFKKHISLFIPPGYSGTIPKEFQQYHVSKATYHFSLDKPFPFALLEKTVEKLVKQMDLMHSRKSKPKKPK